MESANTPTETGLIMLIFISKWSLLDLENFYYIIKQFGVSSNLIIPTPNVCTRLVLLLFLSSLRPP